MMPFWGGIVFWHPFGGDAERKTKAFLGTVQPETDTSPTSSRFFWRHGGASRSRRSRLGRPKKRGFSVLFAAGGRAAPRPKRWAERRRLGE